MIKSERERIRNIILSMFPEKREHFCFYQKASNNILVSSKGKIINSDTGTIYKQFKNANGYHMVNIDHFDHGRRCLMAHRIVMETYMPYIGYDNYVYEVNHINGDKSNNSIYNLEWLTRRENLDHGVQAKLFKNGQLNRKFSDKDVIDIKELHVLGFKKSQIAKSYSVNTDAITRAIIRAERNK